MDSLSSRHLRTKSSTHFSGKNAYAGVFSGPEMAGAPKAPSRLQDYDQIFNCSTASSIPVLDLSEQIDKNVVSNYKSSEMDYNDIFGGFSDEHIGVYYQDLVSKETKFSSNVRTQSTRGSPIKSSDRSSLHEENQLPSSEASFLSFDDKKHFNVSYHKTSPGSKDGSNGTIHVAQFHHEPGFAFFVDDSIPQESKASKPDPSVTNHIRGKLDFSDGILEDIYPKKVVPPLDTQSSSKKEVDSRNQLSQDGSNVNDKLLHADVINLRPHLTKVQLPSHVAANLEDKKGYSTKSTVSNHVAPEGITYEDGAGDGSPTFFGEEVDANSAAAVSAAALRDAIQKAQESIRIAKELMERRKGGLQNHSNQVFKDGLRVKGRKENFAAHEENRSKNTSTKDTWENLDSLLNIFSGRRTSALRRGQDAPYLVNNERTSSFGKYKSVLAHDRATASRREPTISEMPNIDKNRASLSSPDQQAVSNSDIAQILNKRDYKAEERNIDTETVMKQEVIIEKEKNTEENTEKAHALEFIEKNMHAVLINNELEESRDTLAKHLEMSKPPVSEEVGHCEKTEIESQQKMEDEVKFESHALKDFDYRMMVHKKEDRNEIKLNSQQEHIEETTNNSKEEASDIQKIICDEDLEEERFEDAFEWVQNDDEPKYSQSEESNEKGKRDTYMEEEVIRSEGSLVEVHNLIIEEKTSTDVDDHEESGEIFGNFELKGSENGFRSACEYEKSENLQTGTKKMEALLQAEYESDVIRESDLSGHNASDNVTKTQKAGQPPMIDGSSVAKQQVDDKSRSIDTTTKEFCDYEAGEAEEAKVAYKVYNVEHLETASSVHVASEESEDMNSMKTVFEVLRSEGCLPKFSPSDKILENTEAKQRDKDLESHTDPDNSAQIFVGESKQRGYIFEDDCVEKAVKSSPDISDEEGQDAVTVENLEEYPGPSLSSEIEQVMQVDEEKEIEKIIQVDEEMRESQTTQVDGESHCKIIGGKEEEETRSNEEMKTENVIEVNEDSLKEVFPVEGTGTEKAVSKGMEENRDNHEESKRERQREIDRIAVARAIQEARDRAFAGAKEKAERAAVERATAEVRQRVMAEARGKLEKSTTAAKRLAEKDFIEAKLRSERAAVERATEEARARALEKALSQKATSRTTADKFVTGNISGPSRDATKKGLQRSDETYMESAQRSKARLEREERIMERAAKALEEKNMRDLLAQKEDAEKNRLAESLDIEIRRWSAGKEMNLRALLSTLQYILGPGSGWQPISLTDIITSNAVKKAYRKATLYVHPDKLQQRGASIREKYICEKVFDLLKAAWNRFSSEER